MANTKLRNSDSAYSQYLVNFIIKLDFSVLFKQVPIITQRQWKNYLYMVYLNICKKVNSLDKT